MKGRLVSFTPLGANAGRLTLDIESDFRERYDELKDKELDEVGQNGSYYHVWVGSSQYNTREMSILIDGIVSEAKELGIETATPDELAQMKSLWATENP